jgi:hypothetical protein
LIAISSFKLKAMAAGTACVALGAAAGIVGASAAPTTKAAAPSSKSGAPTPPQILKEHGAGRFRTLGPGIGPAVHATVVVLNKAGTGFITVTEDSGTVQSVSGNQLTIKEAVGKVTYRTVTLTIPSGATITRNLSKVALSALKSGDRVRVAQSSEGTNVFAFALGAFPHFGGPGHRPGAWGPGGAGRPGVQSMPGGAGAPAAPLPQSGA